MHRLRNLRFNTVLLALAAWLTTILWPVVSAGRETPFQPPAAAATVTLAEDLVAADFDGDGDLDLATKSTLSNEVYWLEDTGSGFVQHLVTNLISAPWALAAADMDCDGDLDLVIAENDTDSVVWARNDGDGASWSLGGTITAAAADVIDVVVGDVTGDGAPDVVGAMISGGGLELWRRPGCASPTWTAGTVATGAFFSSAALADIDNDGRLDIAATESGSVSWWSNPGGAGSWPKTVAGAAFSSAQSVVVGDLDDDGDMDLAAASNSGNEIAWWANTGAGAGWTKHTVATTTAALGVRMGDIDGDGDLDLAGYSTGTNGPLSWWDNLSGDGSLWEQFDLDPAPFVPRGLVVADLGDDGDTDVAVTLFSDSEVQILENVSTARSATLSTALFNNAYPFPLREVADLETGDIDGDGDADLVVVERELAIPDGFIYWFENGGVDSMGQLALGGPHFVHLETLRSIESVTVGDVDSDGDADLFVGLSHNVSAHGVFCRNDGPPAWSCSTVLSTSVFENLDGAALHDMDFDGDLDLLSSLSHPSLGGTVTWWEQDGDPSISGSWLRHDIDAANGSDRLAAADFDLDGDLDVVSRSNRLWRNNPGGWSSLTIPGSTIDDFTVGDIDGDGDADLGAIVLAVSGSALAWFENDLNGPGSGWIEHQVTAVSPPIWFDEQLAMDDFDVDGDLDLLATIDDLTGTPRMAWFENPGAAGGSWIEHPASPDPVRGVRIVTADFDRDGDPDVVATEALSNLQSWINGGGQFGLATTDISPTAISDGAEGAILSIDVVHNGKPGEAALGLTGLALLFESVPGVPVNDTQMQTLVDTLRLYLDDGDGVFDSGADTEVAAAAPPALSSGLGIFSLPAHAPSLQHEPPATPVVFFLTVELGAAASIVGLLELHVTHAATSGSTAENVDHGTGLLLEHTPDVTSFFTITADGGGGDPIFSDGFESAGTGEWDQTIP